MRAIAAALVCARDRYIDGQRSLTEILRALRADLDQFGWEALSDRPSGDWAEFRDLEFAATLNCLRSLRVVSGTFRNV